MMSIEVTGKLLNAQWDIYRKCVWGNLIDDVRDRWPEGTYVHTSKVVSCEYGEKPPTINTLNSVYEVEWANEAQD